MASSCLVHAKPTVQDKTQAKRLSIRCLVPYDGIRIMFFEGDVFRHVTLYYFPAGFQAATCS